MGMSSFPMRINKYLALKGYCTRKDADLLIDIRQVNVNGRPAIIGEKIYETDKVTVRQHKLKYRYFAYNKPVDVITHSPQGWEKDIAGSIAISGVFPVGRLDKASSGLIILTDDGRITDRLLNPKYKHEKEYRVTTAENLHATFKQKMEAGVDIGDHLTRKCKVTVIGEKKFFIIISEGKKHQIRRMCSALHTDVVALERTRIMNIKLGNLASGVHRVISGPELQEFLKELGF